MGLFLLILLAVILGNFVFSYLHAAIFAAAKADQYEKRLIKRIAVAVKEELK